MTAITIIVLIALLSLLIVPSDGLADGLALFIFAVLSGAFGWWLGGL